MATVMTGQPTAATLLVTDVDELRDGRDPCLLLLSGGRDSTLAGLLLRCRGVSTTALSLDYAGRPRAEVLASQRVAKTLDVHLIEHSIALGDARSFRQSSHDTRQEVWFPYRNLVFLSYAASLALSLGIRRVAMGIRSSDQGAYADASPAYVAALARLLSSSGAGDHDEHIDELFIPLLVDEGTALEQLTRHGELDPNLVTGALDQARSCWRDDTDECGQCVGCLTRLSL